jgi:hypothetical protein
LFAAKDIFLIFIWVGIFPAPQDDFGDREELGNKVAVWGKCLKNREEN